MMEKPCGLPLSFSSLQKLPLVKRVLLQLDGDSQPSSFDSIVAIDSDVDQLLRYGNVEPVQSTSIVHGAMFTRGGEDLRNTAIFVGGSDVSTAERLFESVQKTFFGPVRVSTMLDASGCNTTAAAAVVAAARHETLSGCDRRLACRHGAGRAPSGSDVGM